MSHLRFEDECNRRVAEAPRNTQRMHAFSSPGVFLGVSMPWRLYFDS
jgi:hypothetical protein